MLQSEIYKALNGIFCIYKPTGVIVEQVVKTLKDNFVRDLNKTGRLMRNRIQFKATNNNDSTTLVATTVPDLSDHPLVTGPSFQHDDLPVYYANRLARNSSGVMVMSVGYEARRYALSTFLKSQPLRVYHIKGLFGLATQNFTPGGHVIERSTFEHITRAKLDRVISSVQAGHQKHMFVAAGVDIQSQQAYELAAKGLIRPKGKESGPIIYGMKCINFTPPEFTLEVHSINETCNYLGRLVHTVGLLLRSSAVCTHVHRIRQGRFSLEEALLRKHWTAQHVVDNMRLCAPLLSAAVDKHSVRRDIVPLLLSSQDNDRDCETDKDHGLDHCNNCNLPLDDDCDFVPANKNEL